MLNAIFIPNHNTEIHLERARNPGPPVDIDISPNVIKWFEYAILGKKKNSSIQIEVSYQVRIQAFIISRVSL